MINESHLFKILFILFITILLIGIIEILIDARGRIKIYAVLKNILLALSTILMISAAFFIFLNASYWEKYMEGIKDNTPQYFENKTTDLTDIINYSSNKAQGWYSSLHLSFVDVTLNNIENKNTQDIDISCDFRYTTENVIGPSHVVAHVKANVKKQAIVEFEGSAGYKLAISLEDLDPSRWKMKMEDILPIVYSRFTEDYIKTFKNPYIRAILYNDSWNICLYQSSENNSDRFVESIKVNPATGKIIETTAD